MVYNNTGSNPVLTTIAHILTGVGFFFFTQSNTIMRKTILLLFICLSLTAKPKRKEFRVHVVRMGAQVLYVPQYRELRSLLGARWFPINEWSPFHTSLESAKDLIDITRYEDSIYVTTYKSQYIYFDK